MTTVAVLRVARATDNLDALLRFYCHGLGLELLYSFQGHHGFDGVMVGGPGNPYHLEFTRAADHPAGRSPTTENLLIFYIPDAGHWRARVARMRAAGFEPVPASNPYWDRGGKTFEDPDGYRIVLQGSASPF